MTSKIQEHLHHPNMSLINANMQSCLPSLITRVQISPGVGQQLHNGRLITESGVMYSPITVLILNLNIGMESQQHRDHLQVAVLAGRLESGMAGEDTVYVRPYSRTSCVALFQHFLAFLRVAVSGGFHQFFVNVTGDVRFEELFEQGAEAFAAVGVVHGTVFARHFRYGQRVIGPRGVAHLDF